MTHANGVVTNYTKEYSPQRHRVRRVRSIFLIKNSLLRALRASALKVVADPSFGGSAVQSPSPCAVGGAQAYQYSGTDQRLWPLIRRVAVRAMNEARKAYQQ